MSHGVVVVRGLTECDNHVFVSEKHYKEAVEGYKKAIGLDS